MATRRDVFYRAAEEVASSWEQEAAQRSARTPGDEAAKVMLSCASELRTRLGEVERDTSYLGVAEFAKHRGIDPSTVRRLCAQGRLEGAEQDDRGNWQIPRDARRTAGRRLATAS